MQMNPRNLLRGTAAALNAVLLSIGRAQHVKAPSRGVATADKYAKLDTAAAKRVFNRDVFKDLVAIASGELPRYKKSYRYLVRFVMKRSFLIFSSAVFLITAPVFEPLCSAQVSDTQGNGGVTLWPKGVSPQGITHKDDFGNHLLQVSHRESDGKVEVHQTKADVIVIQSGEADFVSGGEIQQPVVTLPNELQGASIKGGVRIHVTAGDILHVPVGVPHQFFLKPGTQITYFVVKVVDPTHGNIAAGH